MYKCVIWSDSRLYDKYIVKSKSAMQAAKVYGRCEGGEVVQVETLKSGRILSRVKWNPENGGRYIRVKI